jgi:hypothetical protein
MKTLDLLEAQGLTSTTSPFFINNDFENLSIGEELVITFDYATICTWKIIYYFQRRSF